MSSENKLSTFHNELSTSTPQKLSDDGDLASKPLDPDHFGTEDSQHELQSHADEEIVDIENVTVKFRLKTNQTLAQIYPNCMTLAEVKTDLARRFEIETELLLLKQGNHVLSDLCAIRETDSDEYGIYEYQLELNLKLKPFEKLHAKGGESDIDENERQPKLDLNVYYSKYHLPDFITVFIPAEDTRDGKAKNIVVEIQNRSIVKPFLSGYVNKMTGIEYLDAFTQTGPSTNKIKYHDDYASRDTQTRKVLTKSVDTMHDQMSQCWLDGNNVRYWSEATDYYITPRAYTTYAQQERRINRLEKIRLLQRNLRRWKWMRWMKQCAQEYRRLIANRLAEENAFQANQKRRIKREERAKQLPRTKDDFDLLYGEVQKWKIAEMKRIASMYEGASRIAEINLLLDKEVTLLSGIERQKHLVFKAMEDFRQQQLLKKLGEPIKWVGYGDTVVHLDLLRNQRVRFLTEIYKDLQKPLPKDKRLDLLNKVREILINEQDFSDFGELFDLFDRERNLLVYTKHCDVEVLRKRQNILFLELIKYEREPKAHKKANRMCTVCNQVKPFTHFAIRTRQHQVDACKKCYYLKEASTKNLVYTGILRSIQREERKKKCSGSFAFILQVDDVRHIVEQIWHGHSILSKCDNVSKLRLPRWNKREEWSPWNCICLTETEAINHNRIEDLAKVYDHKIHLEVGNRHMLARNAFHKLAAVSVEFTESGKWWKTGLNKQRMVAFENSTFNQ